ncbi:MAG: aldo/keto reductase family protein, partial [Planctomycetota bacterium]
VGLGGWLTFGNALGNDAAREVMDAAFDTGVTFLDNADVYARGECETVWGELLSDRPRDAYVLATKVFFPMGDLPTQKGLSRKHIVESCEGSLRRLRTSHIDLYQCHRWDPETPLEETVRAMDDLIKQGKVVYWGFSMWDQEQIQATLDLCKAEGFYPPKSSQPPYNAINREWEKVFDVSHGNGIGQVVYSPLAQGVLTGKYKPGQPLPGDSRAKDDRQNRFIQGMMSDTEVLERVQKLQPIADDLGCTMAQLALAWCLRREEVTSVIIGATKAKQLRENVEASGIELDDEAVKKINGILA